MLLPTEDIAQAVFGLLAPLLVTSPPLVVSLSRNIIPATQIQADQCPAVFQIQAGFIADANTRTLGGMVARTVTFEWFVYVWGVPSDTVNPSTQLNQIVDACINAIPTDQDTGAQTPLFISGIPCPIWWEPEVSYMEAVPGITNISIARIEVKVKAPPVVPNP